MNDTNYLALAQRVLELKALPLVEQCALLDEVAAALRQAYTENEWLKVENARLEEELEMEDSSHEDEEAAHQDTLVMLNVSKQKIAMLDIELAYCKMASDIFEKNSADATAVWEENRGLKAEIEQLKTTDAKMCMSYMKVTEDLADVTDELAGQRTIARHWADLVNDIGLELRFDEAPGALPETKFPAKAKKMREELASLRTPSGVTAEAKPSSGVTLKRIGEMVDRVAVMMGGVHEPCGVPHQFGSGCTVEWIYRVVADATAAEHARCSKIAKELVEKMYNDQCAAVAAERAAGDRRVEDMRERAAKVADDQYQKDRLVMESLDEPAYSRYGFGASTAKQIESDIRRLQLSPAQAEPETWQARAVRENVFAQKPTTVEDQCNGVAIAEAEPQVVSGATTNTPKLRVGAVKSVDMMQELTSRLAEPQKPGTVESLGASLEKVTHVCLKCNDRGYLGASAPGQLGWTGAPACDCKKGNA